MELGDGRGGQLEVGDATYILMGKIQPLSTCSACDKRYYRSRGAVLPQGRAVLVLATKWYYRTAVRYYRAPHAVLPRGKSPSQGKRETSVPTSAKKRK